MAAERIARVGHRGFDAALRTRWMRHRECQERQAQGADREADTASFATAAGHGRLIYWFDPICGRHWHPVDHVKVASEPAAAQPGAAGDRKALRARLLADRGAFVASAAFAESEDALAFHLRAALAPLEPACLGLYWAMRSEFNAAAALVADGAFDKVERALPFARRDPREMNFRRWDGA
ncbi:MAG: hypothetical protein ABIZ18_13560, partial [Caldimonas sp.]